MRFVVFAALIATACAMDYVGPSWPRLPLDLILRGEKPVYSGDKIVGGEIVTPNSIPSQISLQRKSAAGAYSQSCGGSILNSNTILNAAHCVTGVSVDLFRVVACEHSLSTVSGKEQNFGVSSTKWHESYNANTFLNDISVLKLDGTIDFSSGCAAPIELPEKEAEPAAGTDLWVSGWGTTRSGGQISDELQAVAVPYVNDATCNTNYGGGIATSMICAGKPEGGVDSCQGDSGGPLFDKVNGKVQVGIVSWGRGCAVAGYPGVYTQVSYFLDWITTNGN